MKKIWLVCLCLVSLSLSGCFHVPDEDWLPSRNKVKTEELKKDLEFEQAINSFKDWFDTISSERNEMNNDENTESNTWELKEITIETKDENTNNEDVANDWEILDNEIENQGIEEDIISEE